MGVARGRPTVAACALGSGAGGGRRRLAGPCGPKGQMGRLAAGTIGPKVEGKILCRLKSEFLNIPRL
jgi:hypothetical protein